MKLETITGIEPILAPSRKSVREELAGRNRVYVDAHNKQFRSALEDGKLSYLILGHYKEQNKDYVAQRSVLADEVFRHDEVLHPLIVVNGNIMPRMLSVEEMVILSMQMEILHSGSFHTSSGIAILGSARTKFGMIVEPIMKHLTYRKQSQMDGVYGGVAEAYMGNAPNACWLMDAVSPEVQRQFIGYLRSQGGSLSAVPEVRSVHAGDVFPITFQVDIRKSHAYKLQNVPFEAPAAVALTVIQGDIDEDANSRGFFACLDEDLPIE